MDIQHSINQKNKMSPNKTLNFVQEGQTREYELSQSNERSTKRRAFQRLGEGIQFFFSQKFEVGGCC